MRSIVEFVTVKVIFNCKYLRKCNLLHLPLPNGEIVKSKWIQVVTVIVHLFSDRDSSATESPQHNPNFTRKEERSRIRSFTYFQSTRISTYNIHPHKILILHMYIYVEMYTYMYCARWNLMISQFSMYSIESIRSPTTYIFYEYIMCTIRDSEIPSALWRDTTIVIMIVIFLINTNMYICIGDTRYVFIPNIMLSGKLIYNMNNSLKHTQLVLQVVWLNILQLICSRKICSQNIYEYLSSNVITKIQWISWNKHFIYLRKIY